MKKNKRLAILIALVLLTLLMFLAGYTFARYYKSVEAGSTRANIARWSFGAGNTATTINLSNEKLAPGTQGDFTIEVDATDSEVGVDYEIEFANEKNIPRNMTFYAEIIDQKGVKKTTESAESLAVLSEKISGNIPVEKNNQKRTVKVFWNWEFNDDDVTDIDNQDGTLALDSSGNPITDASGNTSLDCSFDIRIIGKQQKV